MLVHDVVVHYVLEYDGLVHDAQVRDEEVHDEVVRDALGHDELEGNGQVDNERVDSVLVALDEVDKFVFDGSHNVVRSVRVVRERDSYFYKKYLLKTLNCLNATILTFFAMFWV